MLLCECAHAFMSVCECGSASPGTEHTLECACVHLSVTVALAAGRTLV